MPQYCKKTTGFNFCAVFVLSVTIATIHCTKWNAVYVCRHLKRSMYSGWFRLFNSGSKAYSTYRPARQHHHDNSASILQANKVS